MKNINKIPFSIALLGVFSLAMMVPAVHALYLGLHRVAQPFFYSSLLFLVLTLILGISLRRPREQSKPKATLLTIIIFYLVLPFLLAVPVSESVEGIAYLNLYFEMFSCLTTTGATVFDSSHVIAEPIHLWRALVGWLGGFVFLLIAFAILEPMNLGGFELFRTNSVANVATRIITANNSEERLLKYSRKLFPIYFLITAAIFLLLMSTGNRAFTSLILAFSTISTSGILPDNTVKVVEVGVISQFIIILFLFSSLSHTFLTSTDGSVIKRLKGERELRVAIILISVVFLFLVVNETISLFSIEGEQLKITDPNRIWTIIFTLFSFVSTTGFLLESSTNHLSSVPFPILAALTLVGGGVATTAGGIKLIRVYALFKHSSNEIRKLAYPRSVTSSTGMGRDIKKDGAFIAWIFFMLFALIGAAIVLSLSFFGVNLKDAIILTISSISTNGNLAFLAIENFSYQELEGSVKAILLFGMLVGRFEMLAILAVLLPKSS